MNIDELPQCEETITEEDVTRLQAQEFQNLATEPFVLDYIPDNSKSIIASNLVTFDNCNNVAYLLFNKDKNTAVGLYEELKYWVGKTQLKDGYGL